MKLVIIYDSQFGNTEKIAQTINNTLREIGEVDILKVRQAKIEMLTGVDLLVIGSPTQQSRATENIRNFLASIPKNSLKGIRATAFDTRLQQAVIDQNKALSLFERIFGYAADKIAKSLKEKGCVIATPGEGFYVEGMEGPLVAGELERAAVWAAKLFA